MKKKVKTKWDLQLIPSPKQVKMNQWLKHKTRYHNIPKRKYKDETPWHWSWKWCYLCDIKTTTEEKKITSGTTASLKASAQPRNNLQDENAIYRMEEKFCNHILNEGLRSRIYTQLIQQNSMKEWADKQNRHFRKKISKWSPGIGEILNISNHQENVFQNHNQILSDITSPLLESL